MPRKRVKIFDNTLYSDQESLLRGTTIWVYKDGEQPGIADYARNNSYYERIRNVGLNAVRVICFDPWQRANKFPHYNIDNPSDLQEFLSCLDVVVKLTAEHGLYAMINYHDIGAYDFDHLQTFWKIVAPRYAKNTHVFYELANEPVSWFPEHYSDRVIQHQQKIYEFVRELAPDTHLVLLTFPNSESAKGSCTMTDVAELLTVVDWSNASVGFHPYYTKGTSDAIVELKSKFPVVNTEMEIANASGGKDIVAMDGEEWGFQTMERLGISWFAWSTDGPERIEAHFVNSVLADAVEKGYKWNNDLWTHDEKTKSAKQAPSPKPKKTSEMSSLKKLPIQKCMEIMGLKGIHIIIPIFLALSVAILDGLMLALLIPIARGITTGTFAFVSDLPILGTISGLISVDSHKSLFLLMVITIFVVGLAKNILDYFLTLYTGRQYGYYSRNLSDWVFNRYLQFGKSYFDKTSQANISSVIDYNHDVLNLFQAVHRGLMTIFIICAYLCVMMIISWQLTLLAAFIFPAVHYSMKWMQKKMMIISEEVKKSKFSIFKRAYEIMSALSLFRAYAQEKRAAQAYAEVNEDLRIRDYKMWKIRGQLTLFREFAILAILVALLSIVVFVLDKSSPSEMAAFIVFFFIAKIVLPRFAVFHEIGMEFAEKMPRVLLFAELFDDNEKFIIPDGDKVCQKIESTLELQKLTFSYPNTKPVLSEASFIVETGKVTALVGPSGAGKSTIIELLQRFYDVPPSSIFIDGVDIREYKISSIREQIAVVSQDIYILNDTLKNNLSFGTTRQLSDQEIEKILCKSRLDGFVRSLPNGIETKLGDRGVNLSGGQRQMVAIARALFKNSPILILDEATSSLDSKTERLIQEAIYDAIENKTAIIIAHRLSTIRRADKIVVVDNGQIVQNGSLDELVEATGLFQELWKEQYFA